MAESARGREFTPLTDFPGIESDAAISPNGRFVAFVSDWDGPSDVSADPGRYRALPQSHPGYRRRSGEQGFGAQPRVHRRRRGDPAAGDHRATDAAHAASRRRTAAVSRRRRVTQRGPLTELASSIRPTPTAIRSSSQIATAATPPRFSSWTTITDPSGVRWPVDLSSCTARVANPTPEVWRVRTSGGQAEVMAAEG